MKKLLKILGIVLGVAVLAIIVFVIYVNVRGTGSHEVNVPAIPNVEVTPARVERGERIASMLCKHCHLSPETGKMTGRMLKEVPQFGKIYSRNITKDPEIGIGKWSDAEIIYFIRTGINPKSGKFIPPYMPKLLHISDEDLRSVVAFLRSDMPEVQADKSEFPESEPSFLSKFLSLVAFHPYEYPKHEIPDPDTSNQLAWGKYLTLYQIECFACHSKDFKTMNVEVPEKSEGFFGGGNQMTDEDGKPITTLNITPDEETGIGKWSEEEFIKALRSGIVPNGPALRNPMMPYLTLTDAEAKAIYAYLRTVPKISNEVDRGL
ncbi:MAG: c-type cytochrome [Bacteroidetes bacterium]|nr:c-type cytochrome [Bacteroidota bacterium]